MTALAVHWWPADLATPAAQRSPGAPPPPAATGAPVVIGVRGDGDRTRARKRIRAALREAVARMYGLAPNEVEIISAPGQAPLVAFRAGGARAPGIGISHEGPLSLAAIDPAGPVGIDLVQVREVPDWRAVAHDYLGPRVAEALEKLAPEARAHAFASAWTEHEARLKCLGLQLEEWSAKAAERLARCRCTALALPPGFAGTLATR